MELQNLNVSENDPLFRVDTDTEPIFKVLPRQKKPETPNRIPVFIFLSLLLGNCKKACYKSFYCSSKFD